MLTITWQFKNGKNTRHNTWQGKTVDIAAARMARYWNVQLSQRPGKGLLVFETRNAGPNGAAMAQSGNRILINADFRWGSSETARQQMAFTVMHEIGHWLVQDNGRFGHAAPGNVMAAVVGDPFINWTQADMRWFGRLTWKSSLRPWNAPDFFRPKKTTALMMSESFDPISICGGASCTASNSISTTPKKTT